MFLKHKNKWINILHLFYWGSLLVWLRSKNWATLDGILYYEKFASESCDGLSFSMFLINGFNAAIGTLFSERVSFKTVHIDPLRKKLSLLTEFDVYLKTYEHPPQTRCPGHVRLPSFSKE